MNETFLNTVEDLCHKVVRHHFGIPCPDLELTPSLNLQLGDLCSPLPLRISALLSRDSTSVTEVLLKLLRENKVEVKSDRDHLFFTGPTTGEWVLTHPAIKKVASLREGVVSQPVVLVPPARLLPESIATRLLAIATVQNVMLRSEIGDSHGSTLPPALSCLAPIDSEHFVQALCVDRAVGRVEFPRDGLESWLVECREELATSLKGEWSGFAATLWLPPTTVLGRHLSQATSALAAKIPGVVTRYPSARWLKMAGDDVVRFRELGDRARVEISEATTASELSNRLLWYLALPIDGVDLDPAVPLLHESGNLYYYLNRTVDRLEELFGGIKADCKVAGSEGRLCPQGEFNCSAVERQVALRVNLLPALLTRAAGGEVLDLSKWLVATLDGVHLLFHDRDLRVFRSVRPYVVPTERDSRVRMLLGILFHARQTLAHVRRTLASLNLGST